MLETASLSVYINAIWALAKVYGGLEIYGSRGNCVQQ